MAVTSEQVRAALTPEEPDYEAAAELGPEALPHLQRLVEGADPNLASKAAYLAGRIGDPEAASILETAAASSSRPSSRCCASTNRSLRCANSRPRRPTARQAEVPDAKPPERPLLRVVYTPFAFARDIVSCERGVAQSGSAFGWGPKGRWFKSSRPDLTEASQSGRGLDPPCLTA
jgi:hypothetical protein